MYKSVRDFENKHNVHNVKDMERQMSGVIKTVIRNVYVAQRCNNKDTWHESKRAFTGNTVIFYNT